MPTVCPLPCQVCTAPVGHRDTGTASLPSALPAASALSARAGPVTVCGYYGYLSSQMRQRGLSFKSFFLSFLAGGRYLSQIPQQGKYRAEVCPEPRTTRKTMISPSGECWDPPGSELHGGHSQTFRGLQKPELGLIPALSRQGRRRDSWIPPTDTHAQASVLVSGSESHALCQELQFLNLCPQYLYL